MLKKVISLLLIVACCFTTTAFAEGKLKATEKNLIVYGTESYFFAKVENVGDAPIATGNGDLVVFTEDDEILFSTNYVSTLPSDVVLQPGESLFVRDSEWEDALETNPVTDYKFSISPSNYSADTIIQVPSEATFEYSEEDIYDNYVYVTLTNTTDAPVSNFYVVAALRDADGALIYVSNDSLYNVAVHPGSTVTVQLSIDSDLCSYYAENGVTIASVESMACAIISED